MRMCSLFPLMVLSVVCFLFVSMNDSRAGDRTVIRSRSSVTSTLFNQRTVVRQSSVQLNFQRGINVYEAPAVLVPRQIHGGYIQSSVQFNAAPAYIYSPPSNVLRGFGSCNTSQVIEESQTILNADGSKQQTFRRSIR